MRVSHCAKFSLALPIDLTSSSKYTSANNVFDKKAVSNSISSYFAVEWVESANNTLALLTPFDTSDNANVYLLVLTVSNAKRIPLKFGVMMKYLSGMAAEMAVESLRHPRPMTIESVSAAVISCLGIAKSDTLKEEANRTGLLYMRSISGAKRIVSLSPSISMTVLKSQSRLCQSNGTRLRTYAPTYMVSWLLRFNEMA